MICPPPSSGSWSVVYEGQFRNVSSLVLGDFVVGQGSWLEGSSGTCGGDYWLAGVSEMGRMNGRLKRGVFRSISGASAG